MKVQCCEKYIAFSSQEYKNELQENQVAYPPKYNQNSQCIEANKHINTL